LIKDCDRLIQIYGVKKEYVKDKAFAKAKIGDYKGAIDDYTVLLHSESDNDDFLFARGNARFEIEDWNGAIKDYSLALTSTIESEYYNKRGAAQKNNGNLQGALEDFRAAMEINPNDELYQRNFKRIEDELNNLDDDLPF
jgi:tetratricopeptide (TPR) repeat protein